MQSKNAGLKGVVVKNKKHVFLSFVIKSITFFTNWLS
ncbi:hypothetical protein OAM14_04420 [Candidatus Pelagibacter sp.]|nr:hypothetical protein [Candidatus Pelagibacter sp.]